MLFYSIFRLVFDCRRRVPRPFRPDPLRCCRRRRRPREAAGRPSDAFPRPSRMRRASLTCSAARRALTDVSGPSEPSASLPSSALSRLSRSAARTWLTVDWAHPCRWAMIAWVNPRSSSAMIRWCSESGSWSMFRTRILTLQSPCFSPFSDALTIPRPPIYRRLSA